MLNMVLPLLGILPLTDYTPAALRRSGDVGEVSVVATPLSGCPTGYFDKSAQVFDAVTLCATKSVPAETLAYAARVTAQWLDNDEDGQADEPALLQALQSRQPVLLMSGEGFSAWAMFRIFNALGDRPGQDLSAAETNPARGRDAAPEEIHHLIVNAGWQVMLPSVFSDQETDGSALYAAWQQAEAEGLYAYGDPTCDDSCKVVEFFYLATAAWLGSAADLQSDEMRVKTRAALIRDLPAVSAIIRAPAYRYPQNRWPDGAYPHTAPISLSGQ